MNIRKRRSDRSGRPPLPSPGRPSVASRDQRRRFWAAVATGMTSEEAAGEASMSPPVGTRWFRKADGMPPVMFGPLQGRSPADISRLRSERRLRFYACKATPCRRLLADLGGQPRPSPGSCGVTPPPEAPVWIIVRQQRNGTPSEPLAVPSRRSWRKTGPCWRMWKNDWRASLSLRMLLPFLVRQCAGKAVGMEPGADCPSPADRLSGR